MLVSGMALLMAGTAFIVYDAMTFRSTTVSNLSIHAEIIGTNCISALLFNDADAAEKTLLALRADPHVISAAIYTLDGREFATYRHAAGDRIPSLPAFLPGQIETHWIQNSEIDLASRIMSDGKPIGIVCIRSDIQALYQRLMLYSGIGFLVMLVSLLAALLISSVFRKTVAKPIIHLADVANAVSRERNFSLRVDRIENYGEVSILVDAFNEMMAQIEQGEANLKKAHNELEQRVQDRTRELLTAQTALKSYSESILRAKEDIERASKFKDQFLSTMSHELRTPLNAILGFSELLSDVRYGTLNDRQQRYVAHIHNSGQHLLELINDILDLSRIEAGRLPLTLEDVSVHIAFAEVNDTLQPLFDRKSQKLTQFASPELVVRADGTRFRQILMNLLGNAIKFTPEGGKIELTAHQLGNFVRIDVRDSGPGIPAEEQRRIFEAFQRLKQSDKGTEGTGLGLAITRSLIELHGGRLGLESELGCGSCFYFTLPVALKSQKVEEQKIEPAGNSRTEVKVLVIEDDLAAADLLESQLSFAGYEVVVCNQAQRAVDIAAKLQPDVITLDIIMLPVNGWDVLSSLKSDPRTAKIPVVMVTAVDQRATGAKLGADEYIVKPVDRAILLAAIEHCLNHNGRAENEQSILVVEDDPATCEFIADLLTSRGISVRTAADGAQARAQVEAHLPTLIILDLILPQVSGLHLIAEWRSNPRTANLPVFVLTNKDLTQEEREYLRTNVKAFFSKQEKWLDELIKEIRRTAPLAIRGAS